MAYSDELYQQVIIEHNRKPRNFFDMEDSTHNCHGYNPLCGDDYEVYLKIGDDGIIQAVSFNGSGCAISKASASLMTSFLIGKSVEESRTIFEQFHKMVLGEFDPDESENVLGKLKLFKGNVIIVGRKSPFSKYKLSLVSFDEVGDYDQRDAEGFIKISSLRLKI